MFQDRKINNNRHCLENQKTSWFQKHLYSSGYQFGEIFQQGWHDSSRGSNVGNFRPRFQGMGGAAQWLQRGSCCCAKRALNAKPLRVFPKWWWGRKGKFPPPKWPWIQIEFQYFEKFCMIGLLESCRVFCKEFGDHCMKNPGDFKCFSFGPLHLLKGKMISQFGLRLLTSQQPVLMIGLWC